MTALFTLPGQSPVKNGTIVPGAKLFFSTTGTNNPQNIYQDEALTVTHPYPVLADSNGLFPAIYLDPALPSYRAILTDSSQVIIATWDGVPSNANQSTFSRIVSNNPYTIWYDSDGTANQRKYRARLNGNIFTLGMLNDAENTETVFATATSGVLDLASTTTINGASIQGATTGSFTGTLTGMTAGTTGTVLYVVLGNFVCLYLTSGITGTSNSTSMTMTGLPAACQATHSHDAYCSLTDNGNLLMNGMATVFGSTVTFNLAKTNGVANFVQNSPTNFTNSGTKGLGATWSIWYLKT